MKRKRANDDEDSSSISSIGDLEEGVTESSKKKKYSKDNYKPRFLASWLSIPVISDWLTRNPIPEGRKMPYCTYCIKPLKASNLSFVRSQKTAIRRLFIKTRGNIEQPNCCMRRCCCFVK